jgi:hypothetical protein
MYIYLGDLKMCNLFLFSEAGIGENRRHYTEMRTHKPIIASNIVGNRGIGFNKLF